MSIVQYAVSLSTLTDVCLTCLELKNDPLFFEDLKANLYSGFIFLFAHVAMGFIGGISLLADYVTIGYCLLIPTLVLVFFTINPETQVTVFHVVLITLAAVADHVVSLPHNTILNCVTAIIIINGIRVRYPTNDSIVLTANRTGVPLQLCYLSIATQLIAALLILIGISFNHHASYVIAAILLIPNILGRFITAYITNDMYLFRLQYILLAVVIGFFHV